MPTWNPTGTGLSLPPRPGRQLTSAQGPVYQRHVLSQGPKLQARMSGGRLPGQLCSLVWAPASSWSALRASPLPRQTTERRWIPVPHSAEHCQEAEWPVCREGDRTGAPRDGSNLGPDLGLSVPQGFRSAKQSLRQGPKT